MKLIIAARRAQALSSPDYHHRSSIPLLGGHYWEETTKYSGKGKNPV
jgi:hypothetical protein